jgi:hypothetical protein
MPRSGGTKEKPCSAIREQAAEEFNARSLLKRRRNTAHLTTYFFGGQSAASWKTRLAFLK